MGEKSYVELGNQISEMAKLMRTEKKKKKNAGVNLRSVPET